MGKFDLKQVLAILKSGEVITSLKCFTANSALNKGGQILELKECRIARRQTMEQSGAPTTGSTNVERTANHNQNFTVNMELRNHQIRKIHPILIFELNGTPVI
jgi:hypothetical protein